MPVRGQPDDELSDLIDRLLTALAHKGVVVSRPTLAKGREPVWIKTTFPDEYTAIRVTIGWALANFPDTPQPAELL